MASLADAFVLDFHTHWRQAGWRRTSPLRSDEPDPRENLDALPDETAAHGIDLRAPSAPVEQLFGPDGDPSTSDVNSVNEYLAAAISERPEFLGLATVDAYAGATGAEQARYAIEELDLAGIVVDSARHGRYPGSPPTLPTLEFAASRGIPVFVHPVAAPQAEALWEVAGRPGNSAGRGLQNAVALLSALHTDLPRRLPNLQLVFTTLGYGGLLYAAEQLAQYRSRADDETTSAGIYFDTMRFSPPVLRYLGEVLGPQRIVVGSDWPIHRHDDRASIDAALTAAGFDAAEQELIRIGNARRLFGESRGAAPA